MIADDLSNGRCEAFKEENREVFAVKEGTWRVLSKLQKRSEELYEGLKSLKNQGKAVTKEGSRLSARKVRRKVLTKW